MRNSIWVRKLKKTIIKMTIVEHLIRTFKKKFNLSDVFTPSTSAILTFVKRPDLDKQINKALTIPGMQLIVYGHSGSGKTTITQNILNEKKINFISTNCILDTTINDIMLDAFDKLNPFYSSEYNNKTTIKISTELKASYLNLDSVIKSEINKEYGEKKQRALPIQLTPQRLAEFLGVAKVVWILEDFHKVAENERQKLSQILKIFVDTSNKYKDVKVIAIGAVGTAREVVNYDTELNNRISEVAVPLMTKDELESIISKGEKLLNVEFKEKVHDDIINFSNSLASICHHLCFSICFNHKIEKTSKLKKKFMDESLKSAVIDYLKQNSDSFKEILDRALKHRDGDFDNTKQILQAFCKSDKEELTQKEVLGFKNNKTIYRSTLTEYLHKLTTADYGEILRYDDNSGKFSFSNPFFKAFTIMTFSMEETESTRTSINFDNIEEIMKLLTISIDEIQIKVQPDFKFQHSKTNIKDNNLNNKIRSSNQIRNSNLNRRK
ncbi:MAG: AAA family ATPase [Bacteroidota bacterium]